MRDNDTSVQSLKGPRVHIHTHSLFSYQMFLYDPYFPYTQHNHMHLHRCITYTMLTSRGLQKRRQDAIEDGNEKELSLVPVVPIFHFFFGGGAIP